MACIKAIKGSQVIFFILTAATMFCFISCGKSGTNPVNHAPNTPYNPSPINGAVDVALDVTLDWSCTDPDGDNLVYTVYFGVSSDPPLVSSGQNASSYVPDDALTYGTIYYWKIRAKDPQDGVATSPVWSFQTLTQTNPQPPTVPANPNPADGSTSSDYNPTLSWTCSDPNGDAITYDVYFGTFSEPPLVAENIDAPEYGVIGLTDGITYYWKVVATDITDSTTVGPVWSFTTPSLSSDQISSFGTLPRWSPDSQKLVFGGEGINDGLWVYDRSSQSLTQITDDEYPHRFDYRWSASSDQIAFGGAGSLADLKSGIFTVDLNGSDPVRQHDTGYSPDWKPNGQSLVFVEVDAVGGAYGLYQLTLSNGATFPLNGGTNGIDPQYSHQGDRIAFRLPTSNANHALKVIPAGGGAATTLNDVCETFVWTAIDNTIVFDHFVLTAGGTHISQVPSTGGTVVQLPITLSGFLVGATEPTISNGNVVAFQMVNGFQAAGIHTINLSGSGQTQRASSGAWPCISPDGTVIAYQKDDGIYLVEL